MISKIVGVTAVAATLLFANGAVFAQGNAPAPQRQSDNRASKPAAEKGLHPGLARVSKMDGEDVYNTQGQKIGDLKDFMIDPRAERIALAIVATDRNFGLDGKYVAVPWKDFSFDRTNDRLVLKADKNRLSHAAFDSNKWPTDRNFWQKAYGGNANLMRASDLTDMNVRNPQNQKLGTIQDVVFDTNSGRVRYAVLGEGGVLGLGEKYFAIPMTAFQFPAMNTNNSKTDNKDLVLNADKNRLANAPGFNKDNWPDMASTQWTTESNKYWGSASNRTTSKQG